MSPPVNEIIEFGPFRLDRAERVLLRDGQPVPLTLKAFDVLLMLIESSGHIVEKDELMNRVWAGSFVEEGNLKVTVSMLRKALGEDQGSKKYIETVPRRGYRFVAEVKPVPDSIELVVHERTRETLTIEETAVRLAPRIWRSRLFLVAALLTVLITLGGYLLFRNRTQSLPAAVSDPPIKSIVVLPFKPMVEAGRDEILEMGMADTLITKLDNIKEVTVRPMSAVRKYTSLEQDPLQAGQEQKVDAVLDGNIQKTNERVRVTVRLFRVSDGQTLWADKFDEYLADIFTLQDSISERVAGALAVRLTSQEKEVLTRHYTRNTKSYQLYLMGRYYWGKRTEEGLKKGVEYFQQAIEKDTRHALAYADLAASYKMMPYYGVLPPSEAHPKAKEAATKALEIDETLAEAHAARAMILECSDWDWSAAEREFKRTIELKPNYAAAHHWYGLFLERMGRLEESKIEMSRALELDPVSLIINKNVGDPCYYKRDYDQAIEQYQKTLELDPNFSLARLWLGQSHEQKGMYEKAIVEFQKARLTDDNPALLGALGHAYAVSGNRGAAEKIIKALKSPSKRYVAPCHIATIYVGLQKKDEAFQWLERAYQGRDEWLLYLKIDPRLDSLRSDPRFRDLLRRMNLAT